MARWFFPMVRASTAPLLRRWMIEMSHDSRARWGSYGGDQRIGRALMPFWKLERRRTGSPAGSTWPRRSRTAENIARIWTRARWAPRQKWGPWPKDRCSLGARAGAEVSGAGNTEGARLAEEKQTTTLSPA